VPSLAIALVLVAAVLHAGWNVLLKTSGDPLWTAVRLQVIGTIILVPVAIVAWLANGMPAVTSLAIWLALGSGVLEAVYFVCLAAAYRRGALSLVYPLARGSAPLLAVVVGIFLLGERLSDVALLGVACLLTGILAVARPWRAFRAAGQEHRGAIGFALATGASIAAYSAVDRVAVREAEPWLYGAILAVAATAFLLVAVVVGRRVGFLAPAPPPIEGGLTTGDSVRGGTFGRDAVAGVLALTAYLLVLVAYSIAPLATVAPLRESGIVLAAAWGAFRLGEVNGGREAMVRIAAAGLVLVGALLLAWAP
jgi:drug/metabolite transporter (DMT)-like permease